MIAPSVNLVTWSGAHRIAPVQRLGRADPRLAHDDAIAHSKRAIVRLAFSEQKNKRKILGEAWGAWRLLSNWRLQFTGVFAVAL